MPSRSARITTVRTSPRCSLGSIAYGTTSPILAGGAIRRRSTYAAIVFHDAIYVPGAADNEARSAAWLRGSALPCDLARGAELVELTARHGSRIDADRDTALFLDSDMAILGAEPAAFDRYNAAIAREYSAIPADAFRAGRTKFLASVLALPRIFISDYFHDQLDAQARANLTRAIAGSRR
jgi:predicted metal-dependent HD superfamily phosphohydrolase